MDIPIKRFKKNSTFKFLFDFFQKMHFLATIVFAVGIGSFASLAAAMPGANSRPAFFNDMPGSNMSTVRIFFFKITEII